MRETRTYTFDDPTPLAKRARELSGLEFLQELIASGAQVPIGATNGFELVEVREGWCAFEGEPGPWAYNPIGRVHGGWSATILDGALGVALHSTLGPGVGYTTVEFKVNLTRGLSVEAGRLRAEATLVHRGGRIAVTEATLKDAQGRLYAFATSTCMILD